MSEACHAYNAQLSQATNTVVADHPFNVIQLGLASNYALVSEDANEVILSNKTSPIDEEEIITLKYKDIPRVNTKCTITNPAVVKRGVSYTISLDCIKRTPNETLQTVVDRPISAYLNIRHDKNSEITEDNMKEILTRLVSIFFKDDGTFRVPDFVRSALKPTED
jgi:hypothetical protein